MESLTNISAMLSGKRIVVPNYQRAYSWDTDSSDKNPKQVNTFLSDLQDYVKSHLLLIISVIFFLKKGVHLNMLL